MHRKILYSLIFLSFLISMKIWLGWEGRAVYINFAIGICSLILMRNNNVHLQFSRINSITFILIIIAYGFSVHFNFKIIHFTNLLQYYIIVFLNDRDKAHCLQYITKWFGYLMIPSLIIFFLQPYVKLPSLGIMNAMSQDWALEKGYGVCEIYIFYANHPFYEIRFNGPFVEPGHVGMMSAFLLLVNNFDFKKEGMYGILAALICSLSLAGYMLLLIAWGGYLLYAGRIKFKNFVLYISILLGIYYGGMYYNDGQNLLNELIFNRLQADDEKGFSGNNRVFGLIEAYYFALWSDWELLLWGYSQETIEWLADNKSRGTGYVMSMCKYGLVGTFMMVFFYFYYAINSTNRKYAILLLVFVLFMFWQRSYALWTSWIICFIYGIAAENLKTNQK